MTTWKDITLYSLTYGSDGNTISVPKGWHKFFESQKANIKIASAAIVEAVVDGKEVYPPPDLVWNVFHLCPDPEKLKAVIVGQDCYHGPGQAMGLSFSVSAGVKVPSSLRNIFKEMKADGSLTSNPKCGDLIPWARQGVFLMNTAFTVEKSTAGSHLLSWTPFSTQLIRYVSSSVTFAVWILWGRKARDLKKSINKMHSIVESAHPSGLSAHRGFFDSKPFSKVNKILDQHSIKEIDWNL